MYAIRSYYVEHGRLIAIKTAKHQPLRHFNSFSIIITTKNKQLFMCRNTNPKQPIMPFIILKKRKIVLSIIYAFVTLLVFGQNDTIRLNMIDAIELAQDSSLSAFRSQYAYEAGYWGFRNYQARRLPTLNMNVNPFTYNRSITIV